MNHRSGARFKAGAFAVTAAVCASFAITAPAQAAVVIDTEELREAVTLDGVRSHQQAFQDIADANGGTRQAGTEGHVQSVEYVQGLLEEAGYTTTVQPFSYDREDLVSSVFEQLSPVPTSYALFDEYYPMESNGATVEAAVEGVDLALGDPSLSTSGCEAEDFDGFTAGHIALIQRGACSFEQKAVNAVDAGASGAIIFNQGDAPTEDRQGMFYGTLGDTFAGIPVVSTTFAIGESLAASGSVTVKLGVEMIIENVDTMNLIADSPTGRADRTVVVGGHLDSVGEGPGINDNGSGTAAILETALQMADMDLENRVRFAFWSGEEDGLLGSSYYVEQLSKSELKEIALNLNFDMVGSPNAVNFVYDGDGSAFGFTGPNGSNVIEDVFTDFFGGEGESTEPTAFDGRSDYLGFIDAGIPAGGLFTGAEGIKTEEQAALYGGTAGEQYDPCYHLACDTYDNNSNATLDLMSDAIAHATLTFAETTSAVNGTAKGKAKGHEKLDAEYRGSSAVR